MAFWQRFPEYDTANPTTEGIRASAVYLYGVEVGMKVGRGRPAARPTGARGPPRADRCWLCHGPREGFGERPQRPGVPHVRRAHQRVQRSPRMRGVRLNPASHDVLESSVRFR